MHIPSLLNIMHSAKKKGCGSSIGSVSALQADPRVRHILLWKNDFLPLIQEELVVSNWRKNGHLILVNCIREAASGRLAQELCG